MTSSTSPGSWAFMDALTGSKISHFGPLGEAVGTHADRGGLQRMADRTDAEISFGSAKVKE